MDVSPETKLNQQLTFSYKSFAGSSELADGFSPGDSSKNHAARDLSHLPKEIPLKQLVSGTPDGFDRNQSMLKETDQDSSSQDTLILIYAVLITLSVGVTIALILHVYFGQSLVFVKGALVSDHERCTALGQRVLHDHGSSVDAAITAALCLGVVHPHVSGVGGGGVMLIHDIHRNKTRVINFQGTVPKLLKEEMLQNVPELKAGLQVGVPGMLLGLHHAHNLYGSLSWDDVVSRAAAVAREGFNVSVSLADAVSKVKGEQLSQRFRDVFLPDGRALSPGSLLRMPSLAGVLEAGLSNFYNGNFSQEMEDEVRAHGGVLSRDDVRNYSVHVEQPVEGRYDDFIIQVPPPPSAGATLISALNLLQNFHLSDSNTAENQTHHWSAETLKVALAMGGLTDPELLSDMLSKTQAQVYHHVINDSTIRSRQTDLMAAQVVVMGPDDLMVSVASSLSRPFGSRIITRSGVILNSLILDFLWPNKTQEQLSTNQKKSPAQSAKSPLSSLMPTIVVPTWHRCGTYVVLSSTGGQQSLSVVTQVLISVLSLHKMNNHSLSLRRPPPQLQSDKLHVDSDEFAAESVQSLHERGHVVPVLGIQRNKDVITAINTSSII